MRYHGHSSYIWTLWRIKLTKVVYIYLFLKIYQSQNIESRLSNSRVYFTITSPSVMDRNIMHLTSQTLTTFEPPELKVKAGFTVRASGLWCQMLATLVNRSDRDTQVSHVIWVGSRPCDVSRLSNSGVVIWPTFVFSFNLALFQWHRDTGLPIPAKDMERICSHLMSDGRHWFCS